MPSSFSLGIDILILPANGSIGGQQHPADLSLRTVFGQREWPLPRLCPSLEAVQIQRLNELFSLHFGTSLKGHTCSRDFHRTDRFLLQMHQSSTSPSVRSCCPPSFTDVVTKIPISPLRANLLLPSVSREPGLLQLELGVVPRKQTLKWDFGVVSPTGQLVVGTLSLKVGGSTNGP